MGQVILRMLAPELLLAVAASLILLLGLARNRALPALAFLSVVTALCLAFAARSDAVQTAAGMRIDALTWYTRLIGLGVGLVILLVNFHVPAAEDRGEFLSLLLFSLAGVLVVGLADDLILMFLALELVSIPTYIMIALSRVDARAQESSVKYFFLGSFAAALMLYGFSFLYGVAGTTTMFGITDSTTSLAAKLSGSGALQNPLALIGLLLVFAGLAFKMAAVPFHSYAADVYQGAAAPVSGMLGFVPKIAGLVALIRVLSMTGWQLTPSLFWMLWIVAAATMTIGNLLALMQNNAKRTLAYSSIAHSGYMLVAILAGPGLTGEGDAPTRNGVTAAFFYIPIYGLMNLGAFAALAYIRGVRTGEPVEEIDELSGAARRHPAASLALAICLLSLMGFPPTAGFLGKFYIFSSAFASSGSGVGTQSRAMIALVVVGVVNAAIAAAYYLRMVATCYLRPSEGDVPVTRCRSLRIGLAVCSLAMLVLFIVPGLLSRPASEAGQVAHVEETSNPFADRSAASVQR